MSNNQENIENELKEVAQGGNLPTIVRFILSAVGGVFSAGAGAWSESEQKHFNNLVASWMKLQEDEIKEKAEILYTALEKEGITVLYDDRNEGPGTKLNDADLIGIPLRLVISTRTLEKNSVEWKERDSEVAKGVGLKVLSTEIKSFYSSQ